MWKSAVGAVTSNSATYIREWVAHQYIVGFDKIIVVLDNCDDDTFNQIQRLPWYVLERVDVHNNQTPAPHYNDRFQYRAYQKIYDLYNDKVEWLAMFDDDEFFYDHQRRKINDLLANISANQVVLPWVMFGHSGQVYSPPYTRFESFQHVVPQERLNGWYFPYEVKSIVRFSSIITENNLFDSSKKNDWWYNHCANHQGDFSVTFDGREHKLERGLYCKAVYEHLDTCLAHYFIGSMSEFATRTQRWQRVPLLGPHEIRKSSMDRFLRCRGGQIDARMMIYVDELNEILGDSYPGR